MKIKIGPFWWTVVFTETGLLDDSDGKCDLTQCTIYIRESSHPTIQRETLLHEIQHAIAWMLGDPINLTQQEKMFRPGSPALLDVLRVNNDLVEYLLHE